jgi:phosphate-selective porin
MSDTTPIGVDPEVSEAALLRQIAGAWGAGIAWHLAPAVRFAANYERTSFTAGAATGNRVAENFLAVRIQESF